MTYVRPVNRPIVAFICLLTGLALLGGCGESSPPPVGANRADAGYDEATTASCDDFSYWQEAQDALALDSELEALLDDDFDGVACNELGQAEFEEAWPDGYVEACEAVFLESPDGVLYLDGTGYAQDECENTDSGAGVWEAHATGEPATDGKRDAWTAACDAFFNSTVGGDLYWGDDVEVTQIDCEYASPY